MEYCRYARGRSLGAREMEEITVYPVENEKISIYDTESMRTFGIRRVRKIAWRSSLKGRSTSFWRSHAIERAGR